MLDIQLPITDSLDSAQEDGQGKFRYDEHDSGSLRLGTQGVRLSYSLLPTVKLHSSILYNADPDGKLAVTEAFLHYRPVAKSIWRHEHKIGAFYPRLSLENTSLLWTPLYTTTPSVINSWIGEEVRTLGLESRWIRKGRFVQSPHDFSLLASLYWGNDSNGALLAWRGWSNSDRQTGLGEKLELLGLPNLIESGAFFEQDPSLDPFVELDNRPGMQIGGEWKYANQVSLSLNYYDNQGKSTVLSDGQYVWKTNFWHAGLNWKINRETELIAQYLSGYTEMNGDTVQADFEAGFVMLSRRINKGRLSARWEIFSVDDLDRTFMDSNDEFGHSFTLAYTYNFSKKLKFGLEGIREHSNRMARRYFSEPEEVTETQLLANLRYFF